MTRFDDPWDSGTEQTFREALTRLSQDVARLINVEAGLEDAIMAARHADLLSDLHEVVDVEAGLNAIISPEDDGAPATPAKTSLPPDRMAPLRAQPTSPRASESPAGLRIAKADLGRLMFLTDGASSKIFAVPELPPAEGDGPLAYKEFSGNRADRARAANLAADFRATLSPDDQRELDRFSAWPRAVVTDSSGASCGVLMPLASAEYFVLRSDLDSGKVTSRLRSMSMLAGGRMQSDSNDRGLEDPDLTDRLILLAQLAYAAARLHKLGWVYGDLTLAQAACALEPPRLMLLGCEEAAPLRDLSRQQTSSPDWEPPECSWTSESPPVLQDKATDVYKLGLAILRFLVPIQGDSTASSATRLSRILDAEGADLVSTALSAEPSRRPPARDLYDYLRRAVLLRSAVPEIIQAGLITPFVVRGSDALVEWEIRGAASVIISVGDQQRMLVDLATSPGGYAFEPHGSGSVSIEVRNRSGAVRAQLGDLRLYELPSMTVSLSQIPRPQITVIEPDSLKPVITALATHSQHAVGGDYDQPHQ